MLVIFSLQLKLFLFYRNTTNSHLLSVLELFDRPGASYRLLFPPPSEVVSFY